MASPALSPLQLYEQRLARGDLNPDPAQAGAVAALDELYHQLMQGSPRRSVLGRLLASQPAAPPGLYFHGGVGRGKTLLMNLFFDALPPGHGQRLHFHDFMVKAHDQIEVARKAAAKDPFETAANALLAAGHIVCFDEMEVRDIADAMILQRLFSAMWARGLVVVATSNRHPDDLYKDGLHRDRFLPFIAELKERTNLFAIAGGIDWRAAGLSGLDAWLCPDDAAADARLEEIFARLCRHHPVAPDQLVSAGRIIPIARAGRDVAFADFDDLCGRALAARDYLVLADRYAGLVLAHIPLLADAQQNEARRFIWLVDALYDRGRFLLASAALPLADIYQGNQWAFEFERTRSRLVEMARLG